MDNFTEYQRATDGRFRNIESALRAGRTTASDEQRGMLAIRYYRAIANGQGVSPAAIEFAQRQKSWDTGHRGLILNQLKGAVSGLGTSGTGGASDVEADYMAALMPTTIIGGVRNLRRVPARTRLLTQTVEGTAGWRKNGGSYAACVGAYTDETLSLYSVGSLAVVSNEVLADDSWQAEAEIHRDTMGASRTALDQAFIDPSNAGIEGSVPASVTNGVSPIFVQGGAVSDLDTAIASAIAAIVSAGSNLTSASWIMSPVLAAGLSLARGADGSLAYPQMGATGGLLIGLPCLVSAACVQDSDGFNLTLLDGSCVTYTEGLPVLSTSRNALIEMSTMPTASTTEPVAATSYMASMFQADATALLASLKVNWRLRRDCVQVIGGVHSTLTAS